MGSYDKSRSDRLGELQESPERYPSWVWKCPKCQCQNYDARPGPGNWRKADAR